MPLMKEGWRRGSESVREEAIDESELQLVRLLDKHWAGVTAKHFCSTEDGRLSWAPRRGPAW